MAELLGLLATTTRGGGRWCGPGPPCGEPDLAEGRSAARAQQEVPAEPGLGAPTPPQDRAAPWGQLPVPRRQRAGEDRQPPGARRSRM